MQKKLLQDMIFQNRLTSSYSFDKITDENKGYRLNANAASVGFIYRHIAELMNIFGHFFGVLTDIQNTTMGQRDTGQVFDIETSKQYIDKGYEMLENLVRDTKEEDWLMTIDTPFFGTVSRIRLFSHVLFHNSHHAGQIALTLSNGQIFLMESN
jgi:uncharacterized damage-inducible protein DinB